MTAPWSLNQKEEDQHRQMLFQKTREGDEKATLELQKVDNVRVWSEMERATLVYHVPTHGTQKIVESR